MHILAQTEILDFLKTGGTLTSTTLLAVLLWVMLNMHKQNRSDLSELRQQFKEEMLQERKFRQEDIERAVEVAMSGFTGQPIRKHTHGDMP